MIKYLENFQRTQFEFELEEKKRQKNKINKTEIKKKEEDKKNEEKKEETGDNDKKEENHLEIKKGKEVINTLKLSISLGVVQMFLTKNSNKENDKKIDILSFFLQRFYFRLFNKVKWFNGYGY